MIAGMLMSLNDHGWGNKPGNGNKGGNQGPPDLEELWRDVNRRIQGMLGRKRSGPDQTAALSPRDVRACRSRAAVGSHTAATATAEIDLISKSLTQTVFPARMTY